jgi:type I restriction enzyme M protein
MLDAETKARIDSARDILVGKVPDPKSQVEQITIALIYKFMDDMDRQSEEMGGVATFFSGEFKKYAWSRLLDMSLGGHERLALYADGISVMDRNPNIPQLFRDIFKGAFLPYRDPETLNLFLKEINGFTYEHSERLGDAFEYLLSVLGSQGEAGQFRTPRHIIDFIVRIVDPQKHETILDPACGTAGFLISAYKHILASNSDERPGDKLSGDERARLMDNFCGYDISPDMVRLSRANLYLHGFANPRIYEYDTLTSEDRWDERYDVIMANPPFMSPKGGIRPHNRFSIKARRSEVLFVDYIAEHLHVNGRAGVIVPEGIIFQSQNAYKALRKLLLESYLWCVVSLPPGVFNPYSGVKTSILLLDKGLAKRTDEILFVKVEADGFDLGAQRRPVERDDLPEAEWAIADFRLRIADLPPHTAVHPQSAIANPKSGMAHAISRRRILGSVDVSLSGDRYRDNGLRVSTQWPMVRLGDVCELEPAKSEIRDLDPDTEVTFVPMAAVQERVPGIVTFDKRKLRDVLKGYTYFRDGDVLLAKITPCFQNGKCVIAGGLLNGVGFGSTEFIVIRPSADKILPELVYHYVSREHFIKRGVECMTGSAGQQRVPVSYVADYPIPLPPLNVQRQIVAELDGYRKIIEGARQVIANYKPTIRIDPKWPQAPIGELCELINGRAFKPSDWERKESGGLPIIRIQNLNDPLAEFNYYSKPVSENLIVNTGDLLFSWSGSRGTSFGPHIWVRGRGILNQHIFRVIHSDRVIRQFFYLVLRRAVAEVENNLHGGVGLVHITKGNLERIKVPIPPLEIQRRIVDEIEAERALVDANRKLVEIFEQKIQDKLAEIWGETEQTA